MYQKAYSPLERCQLKFASNEGSEGEFEGYATVYGSNDQVNDTIAKGAFDESLDKVIKMFINHDSSQIPVGDWTGFKDDGQGLVAQGKIDLNHKDGPTAHSALKRGAIDGLSVGFTMEKDGFEEKSDGGRIIHKANLMEISLVNFPCEGKARIMAVKADIAGLSGLKDCENYLRDVGGFSKSMATALVSHIVRVSRGEPEAKNDEITRILSSEMLGVINSLKNKL